MSPTVYLCLGDGVGGLAAPVATVIPALGRPVFAGPFLGTSQAAVLTAPTADSLQLYSYRGGQMTAGPLRPFVHFGTSFFRDLDGDGRGDFVGWLPGPVASQVLITVALAR